MPRPDARPPVQLLTWAEQTLGSSARVVRWRRLTGGLTSIVHGLTVERNGRPEEYELRWWVPDWSEACNGPPEVDVGHCRLNLTVLSLGERGRPLS